MVTWENSFLFFFNAFFKIFTNVLREILFPEEKNDALNWCIYILRFDY